MIECLRFKKFEKGCLLGFADIYSPKWGVEIPGFTLYEKEGQRWVNAPGKEYVDKDGLKKFKPFFFFREKEELDEFLSEVKQSIDTWKAANPEPTDYKQPRSSLLSDTEIPF